MIGSSLFSKTFGNLLKGRGASSVAVASSKVLDPVQESSLSETCFLVDEFDQVVGQASKRSCHFVQSDGTVPLHRAFSVFLFNKAGELLLQQRSSQKITYPNHYTNSCCSHPIADVPGEDTELDAIGIKRAAQRRLNYELGISVDAIPIEKFTFLTRIHYLDRGDGTWGEHEIDYMLFLQDDLKLEPNPNEIQTIRYVARDEIDEVLPALDGPLTPWFKIVYKHRLKLWWDNLDHVERVMDHKTIHRLL